MVTHDTADRRPGQQPFGRRRAITVRLPEEHYATLLEEARRQGYPTTNAYAVALFSRCLDLDVPSWAAPSPPAWTRDEPQGQLALEVGRRRSGLPGRLRPVTVRLPEKHYTTLLVEAGRQGYPTTNAYAVALLSGCLDLDVPRWARPSPKKTHDDPQGQLLALGA